MRHARSIFAFLLLLAFAIGVPAMSAQAAEMEKSAIETSADQRAPSECGVCDGDGMAMPPSPCVAVCVGATVDFGSGLASAQATATFPGCYDQRLNATSTSPEPYPPRPIALA